MPRFLLIILLACLAAPAASAVTGDTPHVPSGLAEPEGAMLGQLDIGSGGIAPVSELDGGPPAYNASVSLVEQFAIAPDAPVDLGVITQIATGLYAMAMSRDYAELAGVVFILTMYVLMRIVKPRVPELSTRLGGLIFTASIGTLGAFATSLMAHGPGAITPAMLVQGLRLSLCSSAVYALVKALLIDHLPELHDRLFPPAQSPAASAIRR